jgi:Kef-type K+ transport system membrane component KefB/Trk K+ transport system NAD-binding subunit
MEHNPFIALLLITGLAVSIPVVLSRFRRLNLPIVVGEILAGVVVGTSGFDLVAPSPTLDFLAEFGFAFLMFLSGLEVDFSMLTGLGGHRNNREFWGQPLPLALIMLALTLALAVISTLGLQQLGMINCPMLMGLILSTTSLGVVAPVLKERQLLGDRYGQTLLVAASLADFATLLLLTIAIAAAQQGLSLDLLLIVVLLAIFFLLARIGPVVARVPVLTRILNELSHATAQIQVRGSFALMVAWVVLAEALGVELILGAFLAGAIANLMGGQNRASAQEKLDAIGYGFFIPIFFIMVGVNLNLGAFFESPSAIVLFGALLLVAYLVKVGPALALRLRFPWRNTLAGGLLLSSRLSLIIAASEIALNIGAIDAGTESAIVLIAVITTSLSPLLFNRVYKPAVVDVRRGVIVVGSDQMTELLARRLQPSYQSVTIICEDNAYLGVLREHGFTVCAGSAADEDTLRQAGAEEAEALIVMSNNNSRAVAISELARQRFDIPFVVAGVSDTKCITRLQELGARVVQPALATAMAFEGALRFPTTFDVLVHEIGDVQFGEIVMGNRRYAGVPLRRLGLPGSAVVLSIKRDHTVLVPHGDTTLQIGDRVALIGSPKSVNKAITMLRR